MCSASLIYEMMLTEMSFSVTDLKRMLYEKACTVRELKKSQKKELEFEEALKKLTLRITSLAWLIRVKATERESSGGYK